HLSKKADHSPSLESASPIVKIFIFSIVLVVVVSLCCHLHTNTTHLLDKTIEKCPQNLRARSKNLSYAGRESNFCLDIPYRPNKTWSIIEMLLCFLVFWLRVFWVNWIKNAKKGKKKRQKAYSTECS